MLYAFFVILGASLWATDTIFRHPLAGQFSPIVIVLLEHVLATILALGIALISVVLPIWRSQKTLRAPFPFKKLLPHTFTEFQGVVWIGVLGSGIATVLFTASFSFVNPTVAILLQKVQPLLVICLSAIFLSEKLPRFFWYFSSAALIAAFFLSFPNGVHFSALREADTKGVILALCAAFFWAVSTVIGRSLLSHHMTSSVLSFWRFFFGLMAMIALYFLFPQAQIDLPFALADRKILESLVYMAIGPGFLGVSFYYRGLAKVPASVATILELSFPLCALVVNSTYLNLPIQRVQIIAAIGLSIAIIALSRFQSRVKK